MELCRDGLRAFGVSLYGGRWVMTSVLWEFGQYDPDYGPSGAANWPKFLRQAEG